MICPKSVSCHCSCGSYSEASLRCVYSEQGPAWSCPHVALTEAWKRPCEVWERVIPFSEIKMRHWVRRLHTCAECPLNSLRTPVPILCLWLMSCSCLWLICPFLLRTAMAEWPGAAGELGKRVDIRKSQTQYWKYIFRDLQILFMSSINEGHCKMIFGLWLF